MFMLSWCMRPKPITEFFVAVSPGKPRVVGEMGTKAIGDVCCDAGMVIGCSRRRPSLTCRNTRQAMAFCKATFGIENIARKTGGTEGVRMTTMATIFIPTVALKSKTRYGTFACQ